MEALLRAAGTREQAVAPRLLSGGQRAAGQPRGTHPLRRQVEARPRVQPPRDREARWSPFGGAGRAAARPRRVPVAVGAAGNRPSMEGGDPPARAQRHRPAQVAETAPDQGHARARTFNPAPGPAAARGLGADMCRRADGSSAGGPSAARRPPATCGGDAIRRTQGQREQGHKLTSTRAL